MTYNTIGTIDSSGGTISISDRGYSGQLELLDNPVIKLDFTGAAATYVIITVTDSNAETVAEWTIDDTLKVNYVEIGDVLRYAVQPKTPVADNFTFNSEQLTFAFVSYDSNNTTLKTTTKSMYAMRVSKYMSLQKSSQMWYSLPSRFRFMRGNSVYDNTEYNIMGLCGRQREGDEFIVYIGSNAEDGTAVSPHESCNYLMSTKGITSVTYGDSGGTVYETAQVEVPSCPASLIAIKWWSKITGCWKAVALDVVGNGYTNDNTIDYWTDMVEDQLKSGTAYVTARFPNATYKDYLYYSDIILGEHMTASLATYNVNAGGVGYYFQDVPVKVSGSWSYKQNDIKDMDFTITIKTYDIDD